MSASCEMAKNYPDVKVDKFHIDILTAHFVRNPHWFDVVVASNLFGDILSDLGPACTGTVGHRAFRQHQSRAQIPVAVRARARLGAGHRRQGPRESDRPDLERRDDARSSGLSAAHDAIVKAIEQVTEHGPRTPDMGGTATTSDIGKAVVEALAK